MMKVWMDVFYVKRVQQRHCAKLNVNIMPNGLVAEMHIFQEHATNANKC